MREGWRLKDSLVFSACEEQKWPCLCCYLCEGHGWLSGKEQSCEVRFHLVLPLCVLLHLREITDKHLLCCKPDTSSWIWDSKHVNIGCSVHPENPGFNLGNNVFILRFIWSLPVIKISTFTLYFYTEQHWPCPVGCLSVGQSQLLWCSPPSTHHPSS